MSPTSLDGGKQTTTAGEHISQLVETLIGRFSSKEEKFEQWRYKVRLEAEGDDFGQGKKYQKLYLQYR